MEACDSSAKRMITPDAGGSSAPRLPPAAQTPVEKAGEYPRACISGSATLPTVTVVETEWPVSAPKPAQPAIVARPSPPRSRPSSKWARR